MTENVAVLGSTGSIGRQTLEVISDLNQSQENLYNVVALTCATNLDLLLDQAEKYNPSFLCVKDPEGLTELEARASSSINCLQGGEGLAKIASLSELGHVVNALVGFAGLEPTLAAIEADNRLLLANKESLVVGGRLVTDRLQDTEADIIPIDSEHSALFQALQAGGEEEVARLILTASGGPFRDSPREKIIDAGPQEALDHPNWSMGHRITVDSATMVNKGFEVIEAHWLFGVDYKDIQVVIHEQSSVHSLVEFVDGSVVGQLGPPDMRGPIQYALTCPRRKESLAHKMDWNRPFQLDFRPVSKGRYPAYELLLEAGRKGGTRPAALNSADEELVDAFLEERISFGAIARGLQMVYDRLDPVENPDLNDLKETDRQAREQVRRLVGDDLLE